MSPSGWFLLVFVLIFMASSVCKWLLVRMNIASIQKFGDRVPDVFRDAIDSETLTRMSRYTVESSRFGSAETLFDDLLLLFILLSGILPWLVGRIETWQFHPVFAGLVFFVVLGAFGTLMGIPFELYSTFGIEKKYGFSTITVKLWLVDFIKSLVISGLLLAILLTPVLTLIYYAKTTWWLLAWIFFALFQLLAMWLYPVVIAPLFNKYEPVQDESLKERIMSLAQKAGFKVQGIYQVDAGKRSRHSNAYFTGIGKTKRIVLYDTLIASHSPEEIVAVLAHEIGHWRKKHIRKQLIAMEILSLGFFYLAWLLLDWSVLYNAFGFTHARFYVGILLLGAVVKPALYFFTPVGSVVSRRFEREADDFALDLTGTARPLAEALKRLAKDNLANLYPHPVYAWFYYSHPSLTARIERLLSLDSAP